MRLRFLNQSYLSASWTAYVWQRRLLRRLPLAPMTLVVALPVTWKVYIVPWTGTAITCKRTSHVKQSLQTTDDDCYSQRHSARNGSESPLR